MESPLERINPVLDVNVTDQLNSWVRALESAVATLNQTLDEVKQCQTKGGPNVGDDSGAGPAHGG